MNKVFVVTDSELGWDCVVAVFSTDEYTKEQLETVFSGTYQHVNEKTLESNLDFWKNED